MTKYLNFFESESGFTEAVEAGQLFFPNVSYTEEDDTVHWNLEQPADPVETPMLRMHFITSSPGEEVKLGNYFNNYVTAMEIDGTPVNFVSGGTIGIAEPGNHTAVYQFESSKIHEGLFDSESGEFDTFTSAEIISAVTEIGYNAFHRCGGLTGVSMSDSVTYISTGAFSNCPSLQSVVLSDNLTSIWVGAFRQCTALASIDIPDSVTTIAFQAFAFTGLRDVTIPDSVTNLADECFERCGDLQSAVIGSGVTTVGEKAFSGCGGLTEIYFNSVTPPTLGTGALDNTNNCPIYVPAASVDTYKEAWPGYASRIKTKHRISASVNDEDKGEVMLDQETAPEGDQVDFDVMVFEPDANQVSSVTITDGNGDAVEYTDDGDEYFHHYSFTMPASDVTISVVIGEKPKYNISASVNDDSLGQVNLEQETASEGDHVEFDVEVSEMMLYQVNSVTITDGNGDEVEYDEGGNHYNFTMPASDVTIIVVIGPKQKHTVTVNSTDGLVNPDDIHFNSDDGEPSFGEGNMANFSFNLPEGLQLVSVQASDCDGNSIEVELNDEGEGLYGCSFGMPGCDVSVFITIEERPMYNIMASVNDDSLGQVNLGQQTATEGDTVIFHVDVFDTGHYEVTHVIVNDGNGVEIPVTDRGGTVYSFAMPASDVTIIATIEKKQ